MPGSQTRQQVSRTLPPEGGSPSRPVGNRRPAGVVAALLDRETSGVDDTTETERDPSRPDSEHQRPPGVTDATVEALGKLSAALDHVEDARGHLYAFHRLCGSAESTLEEATALLRDAGHGDIADTLDRDVLGRNPLPGMWSFQMVEAYDDGYYAEAKGLQQRAIDRLVGGRRHLFEAEMKELRRTRGRDGHEATPDDVDH